mmetsp:Transcript_6536/g.14863  ORF Transcript_6536/g.14863 Transcript_6536/m.14863 type:complete len:182 (-) Transcript_6536:339-884(-)
MAAMFFESWEGMQTLLPKVKKGRNKAWRGHFVMYICLYFECLVACKLWRARKGRCRGLRRHARWCCNMLEQWAKNGTVNNIPTYPLLRAETAVLQRRGSGSKDHIVELYSCAIRAAKESGILQWEALANERTFEVLLEVFGDEGSAVPYLHRAIAVYSAWGAHGKVDWLQNKHHQLLAAPH